MPVRRRRVSLLAAAVAAAAVPTLVGMPTASAYDPKFTHRWITRQAIETLLRAYGDQYPLLAEWAERVVDGVEHEDDLFLDGDDDPTTVRLMRHFYRPTDGMGLVTDGFGTFIGSVEWGAQPNLENVWGYDDAIAHYRAGDLDEAFFALGHVVHLVQDASVPAHTHLDVHGPPAGDNYEDWCTSLMRSEFDSDLPLPPEGAIIPSFGSAEEAIRATAAASYWRNMVPGHLSAPEGGEASGVLSQMFPDIDPNLTLDWEIPGVGVLGKAFFEHEPGFYYFKKLTATGAVDRTGFDASDPEAFAYAPNSDTMLVENIARDMVPVAILHSAGLMKTFLDEIAAIGPPVRDDDVTPMPPGPESSGCTATGRGSSSLSALAAALVALALLRRRHP